MEGFLLGVFVAGFFSMGDELNFIGRIVWFLILTFVGCRFLYWFFGWLGYYIFSREEERQDREADMIKIVYWISYDETTGKQENGLGGLGGWFAAGHRWEDYLNYFLPVAHPFLEVLRSEIIKRNLKCTGAQHQTNPEAVPVWGDGTVSIYSYRAWGDLMAAIWSTEDDKDYSYMDFYC